MKEVYSDIFKWTVFLSLFFFGLSVYHVSLVLDLMGIWGIKFRLLSALMIIFSETLRMFQFIISNFRAGSG